MSFKLFIERIRVCNNCKLSVKVFEHIVFLLASFVDANHKFTVLFFVNYYLL